MGRFKPRDQMRAESQQRRYERESKPEMFSVICSKCGRNCDVPFRPTANKPVYCRDCFKEIGKNATSTPMGNNDAKPALEIINQKLDKIMRALKIN
jgi:CxxC-x17-CxxC domain-containing protein